LDIADSPEIPEHRGLDEFATEAAPATPALLSVARSASSPTNRTPRAFSRVEAAHYRRASAALAARLRRNAAAWRGTVLAGAALGYCLAVVAWLALRCDSLSYRAARLAHRRRLAREMVTAPSPAVPVPLASNALPAALHNEVEELESEGSLIAAALALTVVGYGVLLLMSWRDPLPRMSAAAAAPPLVMVAGAPAPEPAVLASNTSAGPERAIRAIIPGVSPATHDLERFQPQVSAASLKAVWNRTDTRSLQGALASLRYQTLAFHRCGMKMTSVDQAVARCDGSSRAYTIDFRRASDRWMIQRVSSR